MRVFAVAAFAFVGCVSAPPRIAPSVAVSPLVAVSPPVAPAPSAWCEDTTVRVLAPTTIDLGCGPGQTCDTVIAYVVENCTDRELYLFSASAAGTGEEYDPRTRIPPRGRASFRFPSNNRGITGGTHTLRVTLTSMASGDEDASFVKREAEVRILDTLLDRAKAECRAQGNEWRVPGSGMFVRDEECVEVMHDAGRICHDERDCAGYCELVSSRPVSKNRKLVTGRCTKYRSRFGCRSFIGETDHGYMPRGSNFVRMCVD